MKQLLIVLFIFSSSLFYGQDEKKEIRLGNREYREGNYEGAELEYRRALEKSPESLVATYNLGNVLYKRGNSQQALEIVSPITDSLESNSIKSDMFHNLGNYALEQKEFKEAIEHYKNSLRINPLDMETKSNLAYAQKMLKEEESGGDGDGGNQDSQDNKENQDNQDNQDNQEEQPEISPQMAQQMLQAIQEKERETQEKVNKEKVKALQGRQREKNW